MYKLFVEERKLCYHIEVPYGGTVYKNTVIITIITDNNSNPPSVDVYGVLSLRPTPEKYAVMKPELDRIVQELGMEIDWEILANGTPDDPAEDSAMTIGEYFEVYYDKRS